jgi:predicted nucleic acid-binding protein
MWSSYTGDTLYLDTNVLIYAIEPGNPWPDLLRELLVAIDERAIHTFTSELTIAEVLTKPIAVGAKDLIDIYTQLLAPESAIRVMPVDRPILLSAAELRGQLGIKLMDAIHVATARACACDFFLTNDVDLGRKIDAQLRWLQLAQVT